MSKKLAAQVGLVIVLMVAAYFFGRFVSTLPEEASIEAITPAIHPTLTLDQRYPEACLARVIGVYVTPTTLEGESIPYTLIKGDQLAVWTTNIEPWTYSIEVAWEIQDGGFDTGWVKLEEVELFGNCQ
ncbi:hypothetical protein A2801_01635 [Candidatus Woesebacteria bacterium RIFCSPHIGHO2_01_FULL_41_10]|uniref:Uncharacterized protein n=1 Tax=Candidatus Woesebacteria bacterium RIFCSPHIGHO2_01_FULL_41_10 TaxID=1802500 RepID=A0A1F7YR50_9BACT|nr:MAG: hypothetical protein A2801_01635 [Candidatus Woesebacteria bacterium RIFCSPHIGHO2_01_FULL_41_10]